MKATGAGVCGLILAALSLPPTSEAATLVGSTFAPSGGSCQQGETMLQAGVPDGYPSYEVETAGVITSWRYSSGSAGGQVKLKVGHSAGAPQYAIVSESQTQDFVANTMNVYPARIPVAEGDILGLYAPGSGFYACAGPFTGAAVVREPGDLAPGSQATFSIHSGYRMSVAAVVEPDADADGFGDETQDGCPTDAGTQGACPPAPDDDGDGVPDPADRCPATAGPPANAGCPADSAAPETTIDKRPKRRTTKRRARLDFSASEPGATFECKLDAKPEFTACTSPWAARVKRGRHTFLVRAVDAAGNVDPTPARARWKVRRRR